MEKIVTIEKVQDAIRELRKRGEKVSRRNVRAITGGGMGTVHQLMNEAENLEAIQADSQDGGISKALQNAILSEIAGQVEAATAEIQEQLDKMRDRADEAYQALSESEEKVHTLTEELTRVEKEFEQKNKEADKALASEFEKNRLLEKDLAGLREENKNLATAGEAARILAAKAQAQTDHAVQNLTKAEAKVVQLTNELEAQRRKLVQAEKGVAVAEQRANDLAEALVKCEKRISPNK
jgi:chromosome segregation ATPase